MASHVNLLITSRPASQRAGRAGRDPRWTIDSQGLGLLLLLLRLSLAAERGLSSHCPTWPYSSFGVALVEGMGPSRLAYRSSMSRDLVGICGGRLSLL